MAQNSKWFENDIKLPLTPSQKKLVEEWLPKFIEARRNHFGVPRVEANSLEIGAPDLVDLLGFIEISENSRFDFMHLKSRFASLLMSAASEGASEENTMHYQDLLKVAGFSLQQENH